MVKYNNNGVSWYGNSWDGTASCLCLGKLNYSDYVDALDKVWLLYGWRNIIKESASCQEDGMPNASSIMYGCFQDGMPNASSIMYECFWDGMPNACNYME